MTKDTEQLIRRLAARVEPVRPLARPSVRTGAWLAISLPYVGMMILLLRGQHGVAASAQGTHFFVEQIAALATGIAAAAAAFASVVPGSDRRLMLLPLLTLALWLGSIGQGCLADWIQLGRGGLAVRSDWPCLFAIVIVGALPAVAIAVMLRRGAPLTPHLTTALGGLAAAGLGDFGLRFFHEETSVMILVWQLGSVFVLSALAACAGPLLLKVTLMRASCENA